MHTHHPPSIPLKSLSISNWKPLRHTHFHAQWRICWAISLSIIWYMTSVRLWSFGLETPGRYIFRQVQKYAWAPKCQRKDFALTKVATIWFFVWDGPNSVVFNLTFPSSMQTERFQGRSSKEIKWSLLNSLSLSLPLFVCLNHSYFVFIPITLCENQPLLFTKVAIKLLN